MGTRTNSLLVWNLIVVLLLAASLPSVLSAQVDAVFANWGEPDRACLGDGIGGFSCSDVSSDTSQSFGIALGFIDGDSDLDAVFVNTDQQNRVCLGDGNGGFDSCRDVSVDQVTSSAVALDFIDGDTNLDAVFSGSPSESPPDPAQVCLGDGVGDFSCSDLTTTESDSDVALGYVNGDNHIDAVFAGGHAVASFSGDTIPNAVCLGNGDGSGGFSCSNVNSDTNFTSDVALGFINGDADLDAVFSNWGNAKPNRVCLGNGSGVFSCSDIIGEIGSSRQVALGLLDGDVNLDAVFANFGSPR